MALSVCVSVVKLPSLRNNEWDEIIKRHAKLKSDEGILLAYKEMEVLGLVPDQSTLPLVLKACGRLKAIDKGRKIHGYILSSGLMRNVRVGTALVDFYCKCGMVEDACKVFDEMCDRDVVAWNAMVSGFIGMELNEEAMELVREMGRVGMKGNSGTVVALLAAVGMVECFSMGKETHGYCLRNGLLDVDVRVGAGLVGFYSKYDAAVASLVFESLILKNVVSWNIMLKGYFNAGYYLETVKLFLSMLDYGILVDAKTLLVVVQACSELGSLRLGTQMHQLIIKSDFIKDLYIVNALMKMYSNNATFECILRLFERIIVPDAATWNSIISSCIEYEFYEKAMYLFTKMRIEAHDVDARTIIIMLSMCSKLDNGLSVGRSLHTLLVKSEMKIDAAVGNALLNMYTELNHIEGVKTVFNQLESEDVISWNSYISALTQHELTHEAWEQFERMLTCGEIKPNLHTVIAVLFSCLGSNFLKVGRSLHAFALKYGFELNASLSTALTDMYICCADDTSARKIFEECSERDVISWNSLIAGYIRNNQAHRALLIFKSMRTEIEANSVTLLNLLSACTDLANLLMGKSLHAYLLKRKYLVDLNVPLSNALITMYARCGCMQSAESIFRNQLRRDVISWNAIIAGYGSHGRTSDAMRSFRSMLEEKFKPTSVTFVSLISACSHSSSVELGMDLYHTMVYKFNLNPELNHYGCVVYLLGRAGRLDQAKKFINSMQISPDASIWRALLSTFRNHPDTNSAKSIFDKLIEIEPNNAGNYILKANIFAASGHWSEVEQLWNFLKQKNPTKPPGISWIIVKGHVYSFTAGDEVDDLSTSMDEYGHAHDFTQLSTR